MNKQQYSLLFLVLILSLQCSQIQGLTKNPFKKVIVFVMENHSYDNMLGYMPAPIGSLNEETHCNTSDNQEYCQSPGADFRTIPDPPHGFNSVTYQVFETYTSPENPKEYAGMKGFAQEYGGNPQNVMDAYTPEQVPVLSTLASTFTTYDHWFCSVPTCTDPNKFFVNAASSGSRTYNCPYYYCAEWPMTLDTIQLQMEKEGKSWTIHWQDWCEAMALAPMNEQKEKYVWDMKFTELYKKMEDGTLDDYIYLVSRQYEDDYEDPETGETEKLQPNTQHPSEDVRYGEQQIKEVYENLRKSKHWEDTLLLITYDEHGGFYDHVSPPGNVKNPTPEIKDSEFNWERLGVRVPAIAISPWLKQTVDTRQLEHASIPKTIREILGLTSDPLTDRESGANSFITDDLILDEMRTDCPMTLPEVPFNNDSIYKLKPENHSGEKEYNGNPQNQINLLGTQLVKQGYINLLKYQQIAESIKSNEQAKQFTQEALVLLGYRPSRNLRFKYLHENMKSIME